MKQAHCYAVKTEIHSVYGTTSFLHFVHTYDFEFILGLSRECMPSLPAPDLATFPPWLVNGSEPSGSHCGANPYFHEESQGPGEHITKLGTGSSKQAGQGGERGGSEPPNRVGEMHELGALALKGTRLASREWGAMHPCHAFDTMLSQKTIRTAQ